ncbi:MAG: transposase [Thermoanaerobaculia bacterium]
MFFRYDRKLLGELAGCAWRALKLYFEAYFDGTRVTPGAVGFVQTAGELLNFHPHVHVLVTDGGFRPDGSFRPLVWFDPQQVERLFRAEVLRNFSAAISSPSRWSPTSSPGHRQGDP